MTPAPEEPDREITFVGHLIIKVEAQAVYGIIMDACDDVDPIDAAVAAKRIVEYFMSTIDQGKPGLDS